jgi:GntR family transcriptional regulator, transcriptional repressor for pyruvate dehydrogenase complex
MFGQILARLDQALERSSESPFGRDEFGLQSFPPHRDLADAILAADSDRACTVINCILDIVEEEIRAIIGVVGKREDSRPPRAGSRGFRKGR